jgi:protein-tyrosine phosphatase
MFREVALPKGIMGRLLLHSMPGRHESLESAWAAARKERVRAVVRLACLIEIRVKSPGYSAALANDGVPFEVLACETPDFGVPENWDTFWGVARSVSERLRSGEVVLVHCGAGIGRTGTFAVCVLLALGESVVSARDAVSVAGSYPETIDQMNLVDWCASQLSTGE